MSSRRAPRELAGPIAALRDRLAPQTPLGRVQARWEAVVGERIAAVSEPVAEAEGTVTVDCETAVWAEQLSLMSARILANLEEADPDLSELRGLRFRVRRH